MCKFILFMSFCILLGAGTRLGNGSLVVTPMNMAVVDGQRMVMECRTDNESFIRGWAFYSFDNPSKSIFVAQRTAASTGFTSIRGFGVEVDKSGSVFLYSNATQVEDAGIYTCRAETGLEQKEITSSAALVVFRNEIMCETNKSEDCVVMQCKVQFRGHWSPTVEWEQHGADSNESYETYLVTNVNDTNNNSDKSITSSILVDLKSIKCDSFFSFKTYFEWHNISLGVTARNMPEFSHIWNSPPPNVCPSMMKESFYMYLYLLYAIIGIVCLVTAVVIVCIVLRRKTAGSSSMELDICQDQTEITEPLRMELDIYQEVTETRDWSSVWDMNEFQMINGCPTADHDIYQDEIEIAGCSTAEHDIILYQDETEIADAMMAYSTYQPDAEDGLLFDNTIRFMGQEPAEPDSIGLYAEAECLD